MAGPGLLVDTTYVSGPNDKLAAVDVYKKPGAAVVSSWQDLGAKVGLDVLGALTGSGRGVITDLIKSVANGRLQLDPQAILNRMTGGNNALGTALRSVSSTVKGGLAIPSNLSNSAVATINGTVQAVSTASMDDVRGLASVVNAATNGAYGISIVDNGALAGMVASISLQGSALGLPNIFSTLSGSIQSASILNSAAGMIMRTAVRSGNVGLVLDIASTPAGAQVGLQYPNVVSDLFRYAKPARGMASQNYPAYYTRVKTAASVMQPGWNSYSRKGGPVYSAVSLNKANNFSSNMVAASGASQGNGSMAASLTAGTSAQDHLTDDKVAMCARNMLMIDGEPEVTNMVKRNYPLVNPDKLGTPTTSTAQHSGLDAYALAGSNAQGTTINGIAYDPNILYIDGEPQRTNMPRSKSVSAKAPPVKAEDWYSSASTSRATLPYYTPGTGSLE